MKSLKQLGVPIEIQTKEAKRQNLREKLLFQKVPFEDLHFMFYLFVLTGRVDPSISFSCFNPYASESILYCVSLSLCRSVFSKNTNCSKNVEFNQLKSSFDEFTFHQKNSKERFSKEKNGKSFKF